MVTIREEKSKDIPHVQKVIEKAFKRDAEAKLADLLRISCPGILSLVVEDDGKIIGHLMFTPVPIKGEEKDIVGMGLAPMSVIPERQRQGIGSQLIATGLEMLREKGCPFVIVLGHPDYYPRFGFQPASRFNISSQWDNTPDNAFMVLILDKAAMENVSGIATFRDEFNEA